VNDAVLVNVPEEVEMAETLRNVPSLVRLQPLQDCNGVFVQESQNAMGLESSRVASEGESDFPSCIWFPEFLDRVRAACEKPGRLVECRAGVVNNIPDHEAQAKMERRVLDAAQAQDVASGLVIELIDDTKRLRFKPELALKIESFQLLDCPIKLGSRS
jgi:hypothetical protein